MAIEDQVFDLVEGGEKIDLFDESDSFFSEEKRWQSPDPSPLENLISESKVDDLEAQFELLGEEDRGIAALFMDWIEQPNPDSPEPHDSSIGQDLLKTFASTVLPIPEVLGILPWDSDPDDKISSDGIQSTSDYFMNMVEIAKNPGWEDKTALDLGLRSGDELTGQMENYFRSTSPDKTGIQTQEQYDQWRSQTLGLSLEEYEEGGDVYKTARVQEAIGGQFYEYWKGLVIFGDIYGKNPGVPYSDEPDDADDWKRIMDFEEKRAIAREKTY